MAREASALGVGGWVRNCVDGRVEAVVEGPRDAVDRIIAWCRQGPPSAHVEEVTSEAETCQGSRQFEIVD